MRRERLTRQVQRLWRGRQGRAESRQRLGALYVLQSVARMRRQRGRFRTQQRLLRRLAQWIRGFATQLRHVRVQRSTRTLQRVVRGHRGRREHHRMRVGSFRLRRALRIAVRRRCRRALARWRQEPEVGQLLLAARAAKSRARVLQGEVAGLSGERDGIAKELSRLETLIWWSSRILLLCLLLFLTLVLHLYRSYFASDANGSDLLSAEAAKQQVSHGFEL